MTGWTQVRTGCARLSWIAAAVLVAALPLAQGCATDRAGEPGPDEEPTGEMVISLTQPGPHGEIYQLANATFDITSLDTGTVITVDGSPPTLSVPLPPGRDTVFLRPGWTLGKSTDGGVTLQPVSALLGSFNPAGVRVLANQPAFVRFDFLVRQTNGTKQRVYSSFNQAGSFGPIPPPDGHDHWHPADAPPRSVAVIGEHQ